MKFLKKIESEWKKLWEKIKKFFGSEGDEGSVDATPESPVPAPQPQPVPAPQPTPAPQPEPQPEVDPYNGMPPGEYVGWRSNDPKHKYNNWEPLKTERADRIDSFLWKPESDNTHLPVVVVSCDKVRRGDLFIELYDRNWNRVSTGKSSHNGDSRGNRIHTYARINYYMKKDMNHFVSSAPFNVKFYQMLNGAKHYLHIGNTGKDYFVIDNPHNRYDKRYK